MLEIKVRVWITEVVVNNFLRYRVTGDKRTGAFESLGFA